MNNFFRKRQREIEEEKKALGAAAAPPPLVKSSAGWREPETNSTTDDVRNSKLSSIRSFYGKCPSFR